MASNSRPRLIVGLATDRGRTRPTNQDAVDVSQRVPEELIAGKGRLLVVADGFGQDVAGRPASAVAIQALTRAYYEYPGNDVAEALRYAMQQANAATVRAVSDAPANQGGTTLTAAVVHHGMATIAHVGDSRAYLLHKGGLRQLTHDHTWVAEQVRAGKLTAEEAAQHPKRGHLARALGIEAAVEAEQLTQPLAPGDTLLLCTDGLTDQVDHGDILRALQAPQAQAAAQQLVELANHRGGHDNVSVIVAHVTPQAASASGWLVPLMVGGATILAFLLLLSVGSLSRPFGRSFGAILPSATVAPTPSPVESPPAAVVPITPTPVAIALPTPTEVTPTPRPETPTPRPAALRGSPTPQIIYAAPELVSPREGTIFHGRREEVRLKWRSVGMLQPDDYYVVILRYPHDGQVWQDEQQTKDTELVLPTYLLDLATGTREFQWHVVIWRAPTRDANNHLTGTPVGPASAVSRFVWLPEEPAEPTTPVEPTVEATPTPRYEG